MAGVDEPVEVCEVAAAGADALTPPPSSEKAQRVAEATASSTAPAPAAEPLLAVLAFDNLSNDPEMQFFSDGVSEEIIQLLSRGRNQGDRAHVEFQFRGERKAEAAEALHCTHVLDGSIRRVAARVRVSAHLMEAASQTTLWSERYDRGLEDIFAVQDEISESIARALDRPCARRPRRWSRRSTTCTCDRAQRATRPTNSHPHRRAGTRDQRAPQFAAAWGRLAYLRAFLRFYQPFAERAASAAQVNREAERALALDAQNLDAMAGQYFVIAPFGQFVESDAALDRLRRAPGTGDGAATSAGRCATSAGCARR